MIDALGYLSDLSILIAFLATVFRWRRLPGPAKLIGIQVALSVIAELSGWYLSEHGQPNAWVYNCYLLPETFLLAIAGYRLTAYAWFRKTILAMLAAYLVTWVYSMSRDGKDLINVAFLFECTILTAVFLQLMMQWYLREGTGFFRNPLMVMYLSTVLYFGCNIPLFGMLNYMNAHYPKAAEKAFMINYVLNLIRYLSIAYAFLSFRPSSPEAKMASL